MGEHWKGPDGKFVRPPTTTEGQTATDAELIERLAVAIHGQEMVDTFGWWNTRTAGLIRDLSDRGYVVVRAADFDLDRSTPPDGGLQTQALDMLDRHSVLDLDDGNYRVEAGTIAVIRAALSDKGAKP